MKDRKNGLVSVVPTPIGNLEDITLRAIRIVQEADILLCEDTRTTGKLLSLLEIPRRPLLSFHARNESARIGDVLERLAGGDHIALLSDAGTPGMSDPGLSLIGAVIEHGYDLDVLPGPTAFVPALLMSGLPALPFHFEGFLPHKKGRKRRIEWLARQTQTIVLYESPHRICRLLTEFSAVAGPDRRVAVAREISKLHQETLRGSLAEVLGILSERPKVKGEIVLVVEGTGEKE